VSKFKLAVIIVALFVTRPASAAQLFTCFTPDENCTRFIVRAIEAARSQLLVLAYGFTSCPIIQAIGEAKDRGIDVKIILDRSNRRHANVIAYLQSHGIEPQIDELIDFPLKGIAHNKVMIIDRMHTLTGSFNFTPSAQQRNTENILLVKNHKKLALTYKNYWESRASAVPSEQPSNPTSSDQLSCSFGPAPDRLRLPRRRAT
jgi:phosphatidylserine/phosphatidylglycerophosphate/cardiolipin synthase-like enzyme